MIALVVLLVLSGLTYLGWRRLRPQGSNTRWSSSPTIVSVRTHLRLALSGKPGADPVSPDYELGVSTAMKVIGADVARQAVNGTSDEIDILLQVPERHFRALSAEILPLEIDLNRQTSLLFRAALERKSGPGSQGKSVPVPVVNLQIAQSVDGLFSAAVGRTPGSVRERAGLAPESHVVGTSRNASSATRSDSDAYIAKTSQGIPKTRKGPLPASADAFEVVGAQLMVDEDLLADLPVLEGRTLGAGRARDRQLRVPAQLTDVSRAHVDIDRSAGQIYVTDKSEHGTFLVKSGAIIRLTRSERTQIRPDSVLWLDEAGQVRIAFRKGQI